MSTWATTSGWQAVPATPRITLAGSVRSCKEAQALAAQNKRPLRIAEQAWQQIVAAHAAPKTVPDGVTVT